MSRLFNWIKSLLKRAEPEIAVEVITAQHEARLSVAQWRTLKGEYNKAKWGKEKGRNIRQVIAIKESLMFGKVCCYVCGKPLDLESRDTTREHIKPTAAGGLNRLQNLALSCKGCNFKRGTNFTKRFEGEYNGRTPLAG